MGRIRSMVAAWALPLVLMAMACGEEDPITPDPCESANPPASCNEPEPDGYAFVYEPPAGAPDITSIVLRGEFNSWGPPNGADIVMEEQADGSFVGYVELDSTITYAYKFVINGAWIPNMCHDETWGHEALGFMVHEESDGCVDDGNNGQNAIITLGEVGTGFSHSPGDPVDISIAAGMISIRFTARAGRIHEAWIEAGDDSTAMHVQFSRGLEDVWRAAVPLSVTDYAIHIDTDDGVVVHGPYDVPANPFRSVSWASDAVAYQIFPERFWNGDPSNDSLTLSTDEFHHNDLWQTNGPTLASAWDAAPNNQHCCHQYFGGDLAGIIEKLDHLQGLGVDLIYLNPIWHSGSAHGYDAFDITMLAPEYGDSALLRQFVDAVHARGMRVMWDFVPNHVGVGFWAFEHAVANGETSPYWNWFRFHPDGDNGGGIQKGDEGDYDTWCFGSSCFGSLPKLRVSNSEVFDYLIDVAASWTEYGFDGIRVDVPLDVENGAQFYPAFRAATKGINPDVYLIGEIWERNPAWVQGDRFDALMNYAIGRDVIARFANDQMSGAQAWSAMVEMYATYPEAATAMLFNVIATHDTGRLLTQLGGGELGGTPTETSLARQRLASALQYAIPGMPSTYYGDECAMLGTNSGSIHRSRRTMDWVRCAGGDYGMVEHYTQLSGLKHDLVGLGSGAIRAWQTSENVLSFLRGEPGAGEVLAVFNRDASEQNLTLPAGSWVDAAAGGPAVTGSVAVPAYGWLYLVRQ